MNDCVLTTKEVRTRKEHRCAICERRIRKGAKAVYWSGVYGGDFQSSYAHGVCDALFHRDYKGEDELPDPGEFVYWTLGLPLLKARDE